MRWPWPEAAAWALLLVLLCVTGLVAAWVRGDQDVRERAALEARAEAMELAITVRMTAYMESLMGARATLVHDPEPSVLAWRQYVTALELQRRFQGIQGLGLALRLGPPGDPREAAIATRLAQEGRPGWRCWPPGGALRFPIVHLEPFDRRNMAALGYDMYSEAVRRAAMREAADSGAARVTGRVTLKQEIDPTKQAGFLCYAPFYRDGRTPATLAGRRAALLGYVYGAFRADDLFQQTLSRDPAAHYGLFDGPTPTREALLTESFGSQASTAGQMVVSRHFPIAGRTWTLQTWSRGGEPLTGPQELPVAVALAGSLLSLAAFGLVWSLVTAQRRALALAAHMTRELRQADRAKDEFLSVISHELRTPLNFITGFTSLLEDEVGGTLTPVQHGYLAKINVGAERMLGLVNDLLDVAKIRAGRFEFFPAPTPLRPLLEEVATHFTPLAASKGITFSLQLAPSVGATRLFVDPQRVHQVLENLLANAIKFTPSGGAITLRCATGEGLTRIAVQDTGVGIPPEALPRLFEPFVQVDMSATREAGGSGLGLSISKALIEGQGGRIGVESKPGLGSTFWFELPLWGPFPPGNLSTGPSPGPEML